MYLNIPSGFGMKELKGNYYWILIFLFPSDTGQLLFFQLPDSLPGLPPSSDDDYKDRKNKEKKEKAEVRIILKYDKVSQGNLDIQKENRCSELI